MLICGSNLFHIETVDGKNEPSYTFTQPNIGFKCKFVFPAFVGSKDVVTNL